MVDALAYTVVAVALTGFLVWLYILLPHDMAQTRGRSGISWVLISLIFSPLMAIFLLWILGDKR